MLPKIIIGIIVLIALVLTFGFLTKDKHGSPPPFIQNIANLPDQDYFADISNLPSCGDKKEMFTLSPLNLSDFTHITPLGLLSPTAHVFPSPHLYFNVRLTNPSNYSSLPVEVDVVAPTDLKITTVKFIEAKNRPSFNDGMVAFGVCKEFKAYFDHLKTFSPKIQKAYDEKPFKQCNEYSLGYPQPIGKVDYELCQVKVEIDIKKGEKIGTAGGGEGQKVFDFGAFDKRVTPKQFAKPERWLGREHLVYLICPLDYYPSDLKTELKARLGGFGQKGEVKNADCGEVIQDILDTAMGGWVPPGTDKISHEPPYLALAHDYIEPQYLVFSMGESGQKGGLSVGKYIFLPNNEGLINRHFKDITSDGKIYCFETEEVLYSQGRQAQTTTILLTMPDNEKLRIGKLNVSSCGSGPWSMANYVEFVR